MQEDRVATWVKDFYDWCADERKDYEEIWTLAYDCFLGNYSETNLDMWRKLEGQDWRSKVFVRFARRKVISACAQLEDIYFQGGQLPFSLSPSDVPEGQPGLMLPPEIARVRCGRMDANIRDILTKAKYDRILMGSLLEKAIYGMSVHKCPVLRPERSLIYRMVIPPEVQQLGLVLGPEVIHRFARHVPAEVVTMVPTVQHCNLWDMFWDIEAENFQTGIGVIQRAKYTPGELRILAQEPGYDPAAVEEVIANFNDNATHTRDSSEGPAREQVSQSKRGIEVLEFWGRIPRKELSDASLPDDVPEGLEVECTVVVAFGGSSSNGKCIRPVMPNPLPLQRRPYHESYWEQFPHQTRGVGVCENTMDAQMMINGSYRLMIDNKSLAGNLLKFIQSDKFKPGQDLNSVFPGKTFEVEDDVEDVRKVLAWASPPDVTAGLLDLLQIAERFGDEDSGHPRILQGESVKHTPDTAFGLNQLLESANKQLGKIIRNTDEQHIEPDVESVYHWEMLRNPREDIKGDFDIQAKGFSCYNDKIRRGQSLMLLWQFTMSDMATRALLMPKMINMLREIYRSHSLDPDEFLPTQEEMQDIKIAQQLALLMPQQGGPAGAPGAPPPSGGGGQVPPPNMTQVPGAIGPAPPPMEGRAEGGPVAPGVPYVVGEQGKEIFVPIIPAREEGGPVEAAQPVLVGEQGPEIFIPIVPGEIVPIAKPGEEPR